MPEIRTCVTLSPIPGFVKWLSSNEGAAAAAQIVSARDLAVLQEGLVGQQQPTAPPSSTPASPAAAIAALVKATSAAPKPLDDRLQRPLQRLCVRYLTGPFSSRASIDPVERFHLGNGARIEHVHWNAHTATARGLRESAGLMVSYGYSLDEHELDSNHRQFHTAATIKMAQAISAIVESNPPASKL